MTTIVTIGVKPDRVKTISKGKLKATMLQVFREIEETAEEVIVTDHGRPVLRIQPLTTGRSVDEVFGPLQGKVIYREDVNAPTEEEWGET